MLKSIMNGLDKLVVGVAASMEIATEKYQEVKVQAVAKKEDLSVKIEAKKQELRAEKIKAIQGYVDMYPDMFAGVNSNTTDQEIDKIVFKCKVREMREGGKKEVKKDIYSEINWKGINKKSNKK